MSWKRLIWCPNTSKTAWEMGKEKAETTARTGISKHLGGEGLCYFTTCTWRSASEKQAAAILGWRELQIEGHTLAGWVSGPKHYWSRKNIILEWRTRSQAAHTQHCNSFNKQRIPLVQGLRKIKLIIPFRNWDLHNCKVHLLTVMLIHIMADRAFKSAWIKIEREQLLELKEAPKQKKKTHIERLKAQGLMCWVPPKSMVSSTCWC